MLEFWPDSEIALWLSFWNGMCHDLAHEPQVTVHLPDVAALQHFSPPSLGDLADGYVRGPVDVTGSVQDVVTVAFARDFGALAISAAQKFCVQMVGVVLSKILYALARERVGQAGLLGQVDVRLQDYRDLDPVEGAFDKITSVGMFEHVGLKHLAGCFSKINAILRDGGSVLNHGVTTTDADNGVAILGAAGFISRYVFLHGELPHISPSLQSMPSASLEVLDAACLRRHYARTLTLWVQRYEAQSRQIRHLVDATTYRIWRSCLAGCALAFRQNWVSLYQVLACKSGVDDTLNPAP